VSDDDGFKQLLAAEEKAKEKVAAVRKERAVLMKKAEDDAQSEIDAFKAQRTAQYAELVKQHSGATDERTRALLLSAQLEKDVVAKNAAKNKHLVVDTLLKAATTVDL
jgi:ATP synthase subunit G